MHVERIRVQDFGCLHDLDSGPTPLGDLVVIVGPNEAGKSTLFHFLTTLLYGFSPASRDTNPYAPWSGAEAAGSVVLRLADGRRWEVHRRLRATPDGWLVREGISEELKNRTLPCVEHVPLAIFRQVYAITLGELAGLEGESWARIQDRLVAALGAPDLRPARAVSDELEREAGELWRPNRRGNQRIRQLWERLRELESRRREVASADLTLRDEARELERTQAALADARTEREESRVYVERYGALLQVRASLARVRALEEEAGPQKVLEALPTDPAAWLAEWANQLRAQEARVEELTHDVDASRRRIEALGVTDTRVLERAREIERVAASVQASGWTRARAGRLRMEMRELQSLAEAESSELFEASWDWIEADRVRALPLGDLRTRARELEDARAQIEAKRAAERELDRRLAQQAARRKPASGGVAAAVLGLILVFVGLAADRVGLLLTGALVLVAGSVMLVTAIRRTRSRSPTPSTESGAVRAREEEARRGLRATLAGLPVREGLVERSPSQLVAAVERLQLALRNRRDREAELADLQRLDAELAAEVAELAAACGVSVPADPAAAAHLLSAAAADADRRRAAAGSAQQEMLRLERARDRERREFYRLRGEEKAGRDRLVELGGGDLEAGVREFRARAEAAAGAARLRADLARAHPDLDEVQARIRAAEEEGEEWVVDEEALARRRVRVSELEDRVERLVGRAAALEAEIEQLALGETLDRIDGEIEVLGGEVRGLERERDRKHVLAQLLREADRRFREEHQPALVRRAGEHLASVTDGRYTRVLLSDGTGELTFRLRDAQGSPPVPVGPPLSTATREQVYLALRLAAVDHLDREGERLPLFLDDTLVNWDPERQECGMDLLARLADERQLFVFTCHPGAARALDRRGAQVIRLGPPG